MSIERENNLQVLANPSWEVQESAKITKADLKAQGIRPYNEKVDHACLLREIMHLRPFENSIEAGLVSLYWRR